MSPSSCCRRRNGSDHLAERPSRVAVAHLHDRDAPARHGVTQLHARIYPIAVSVKHQMHPQTQLADLTPLVSLSNLFIVLSIPQGPKFEFSKFDHDHRALTSIYWENTSQESQELDKWCTSIDLQLVYM